MMNAMGSPSISELQKTEDREHNSQIAEHEAYLQRERQKQRFHEKANGGNESPSIPQNQIMRTPNRSKKFQMTPSLISSYHSGSLESRLLNFEK